MPWAKVSQPGAEYSIVQVIEDSQMGIRSAVLTFERRGSAVTFIVIPMMHLGAPRFYAEVQALLASSDLVVMEGVRGRRARLITLAYRLAGGRRRNGLIAQGEGLDLAALKDRMVRPDMTAEQFGDSWESLPCWMRAGIYVLAPLFGLLLLIRGPERLLRGRMAFEDTPEYRSDRGDDPLDAVLLTGRDLLLSAELVRVHEESGSTPTTVTVCWGAHHVPAVMRTLHVELGYRVTDARWITVF